MAARKPGLFGTAVAYFVVHEGQESLRLHLHSLLWTDISPMLIQRLLDKPDAIAKICERIDSMVSACVNEDIALQVLATREVQLPANIAQAAPPPPEQQQQQQQAEQVAPPQQPPPPPPPQPGGVSVLRSETFRIVGDPCANQAAVLAASIETALLHGCHQKHCATCHKGFLGKLMCRFGFPKATHYHGTGLAQIVLNADRKTVQCLGKLDPPPPGIYDDLLVTFDPRTVALELKRPPPALPPVVNADGTTSLPCVFASDEPRPPGLNGHIVDYSPALSAAVDWNSAIYFLGNDSVARALVFYNTKYMTKDSALVNSALTIGAAAAEHVLRYPSTAPDVCSNPQRSAMQLVNRMVNSQAQLLNTEGQWQLLHFLACRPTTALTIRSGFSSLRRSPM